MQLAQTRGHKSPKGMSYHTCLGKASYEKYVTYILCSFIKKNF